MISRSKCHWGRQHSFGDRKPQVGSRRVAGVDRLAKVAGTLRVPSAKRETKRLRHTECACYFGFGWRLDNKSVFSTLALTVVLLASVCSASAEETSQETGLQNALQEYEAAMDTKERDLRLDRFHQAELLFARVIQGGNEEAAGQAHGVHNPDLYVNWGNAALGAEHLGTAVLAYRRALALDPDHERARLNLRHARSLLPDWVPRPEESTFWDTFFAWTARLSRTEWQAGAGIVFLIGAALFAAAIRWRQPTLRNLALIAAIVWLGIVVTLGLANRQEGVGDAVVVSPDVIARAADSVHAPTRFAQPLPSGAEVHVAELRDDWLRIRLYDRREAWIPSSSVAFVKTSPHDD